MLNRHWWSVMLDTEAGDLLVVPDRDSRFLPVPVPGQAFLGLPVPVPANFSQNREFQPGISRVKLPVSPGVRNRDLPGNLIKSRYEKPGSTGNSRF